MNSRAQISPEAIGGAVVAVVIAALVGMIGLRILSPLAARCGNSGIFVEECTELSYSLGSIIAALVGPLGLIVVLVSLLAVAFTRV